ncbi:MAG: hypothetical protein KJ914_03390 [Gammaproteobacteria bacterium]|nr:hypothetical protein [Gammaproteobacteria bacterium]MBU1725731.1 hypothetical protein [Gammaproteobacteria bacterium]MBU2003917.1 hypothetical protein [Gammaproteobacteria bacterium]
MFALSNKNQWLVGGVLLLVMLLTRSPMLDHLQDASWAVFFLLGFYVRPALAMPLFWLAGFAVDATVTSNGMVSSYCFTPAYGFTLPAYATLWAAGRWFAHHYRADWQGLTTLATAVVAGTAACFAVSNIGFYIFAGYFEQMGGTEYTVSVLKYLPGYLQTTLLYVGIAALMHTAVLQLAQGKAAH